MEPKLKNKVINEIERVIGKPTNFMEELTFDKIDELDYLKMCLNESLRIEAPT
jgi:hypothetical protein